MPEYNGFSRLKLVRTGDMPPVPVTPAPYVELGVSTPFSFLRGASDAIELTLTAPEIYTAPVNDSKVFERVRDHAFYEATSCVEDDRSVDPVTARQRFDLTPPSDLAPPPR